MRADTHMTAEDEALRTRMNADLALLRFKSGWSVETIATTYQLHAWFVENVIRENLK